MFIYGWKHVFYMHLHFYRHCPGPVDLPQDPSFITALQTFFSVPVPIFSCNYTARCKKHAKTQECFTFFSQYIQGFQFNVFFHFLRVQSAQFKQNLTCQTLKQLYNQTQPILNACYAKPSICPTRALTSLLFKLFTFDHIVGLPSAIVPPSLTVWSPVPRESSLNFHQYMPLKVLWFIPDATFIPPISHLLEAHFVLFVVPDKFMHNFTHLQWAPSLSYRHTCIGIVKT